MSAAIKWYPQLNDAFEYLVPIGVATNVTHPYVETEYLLPTFGECPFFSYLEMTSLIDALADINGTTTLAPSAVPSTTSSSAQASPTSSSGSSNPQSQTTSGVGHSFGASGGLVVSAALVGMVRLMM